MLFLCVGISSLLTVAGFEIPLENQPNQFIGHIGMGTPPQRFPIMFDTGSSEIWLPGPRCRLCDRDGLFYDPVKSKTYSGLGGPEKGYSYNSGSVQYQEAQDLLELDGIHFHGKADHHEDRYSFLANNRNGEQQNSNSTHVRVTFGVTDQETPVFQHVPFDGIIGMSAGGSSLMDALTLHRYIKEKQFGIDLRPGFDRMFFGHVPFPEEHMIWMPRRTDNEHWMVGPVKILNLLGKEGDMSADDDDEEDLVTPTFRAILDTGSSTTMLNGFVQEQAQNGVPCDQDMHLELVDHAYKSNKKKGIAEVPIYAGRSHNKVIRAIKARCEMDVMDLSGWNYDVIVLGKDFFEGVPTVFNIEKQMIGFYVPPKGHPTVVKAQKKEKKAESTSKKIAGFSKNL